MVDLSGSFWIYTGVMILENAVGLSLGMMLSAMFKNVQMASQLAPAVVILFLIFSGFLINEDSVPTYFVWLREISFIRYAFKAVAVNEFQGASFECSQSEEAVCIRNGDQLLAQLGFVEDDLILKCVLILTGIGIVVNMLAIIILLIKRPKFLALSLPAEAAPEVPGKADIADGLVKDSTKPEPEVNDKVDV
jgi:hypothetical protein